MFASVVIDAVIGADDKIFDYIIPDGVAVVAGSRVIVPFGPRDVEGFVLAVKPETDVDVSLLKSVSRVLDDRIKPELLGLLPQICGKFKLRYIDVLRLFMPGVVRGNKVKAKKDGRRRIPRGIEEDDKKITLNPEQQACVDTILQSGGGKVFVLHGVTGSGKTEVYMNVIRHVLQGGKTALMLVPEIGLTPQVLSNFRARFGDTVAMLHSGMSNGERFDEWKRVDAGEAKIVIGARSAVFAPLEHIGIIIIDEEHDGSYQSESNPRYNTRDIAVMRAGANNCAVVLGSATPSVETYHKTANKEYKLLELPSRINNLSMPLIEIVDMCGEIRSGNGGIFSRVFLESLFDTLRAGRCAMIFLNRRGYSQSVRCYTCGWVARCENCDIALVYHKEDEQLKCHYCDARFTAPVRCPQCGAAHLHYGVMGTQKIVSELEKMLRQEFSSGGAGVPVVLRMDADNTKTKGSLIEILTKFANTAPAVLVGTQMIAKGHHFPNVDLVGVIDADSGLHITDYRAAERTFNLITQVSGRAGRDSGTGRVFVQTYMPKSYVYKFAKDYDYKGFYEKEINTRTVTKYPPFSTIIRVLVSGSVDTKIKAVLEQIMKRLRELPEDDFIYLGAMRCPHGRLQNKFRYQILARIKPENADKVVDYTAEAVKSAQSLPAARTLQIFLEINPGNLS